MQLVIDIDDNEYNEIKMSAKIFRNKDMIVPHLYEVIELGTPLPKGHGKIIDTSQLLTVTECREDGTEYCYVPYTHIEDALAIVEADKVEGDDKE